MYQGMFIMKAKLVVIALAGLLAATGASAQDQKGKTVSPGGGARVQTHSQGGGNIGRRSVHVQSQNRMNVQSQHFNRNAKVDRQFTNRQLTNRNANADRRFTNRNVKVNRNVNVNRKITRERLARDRDLRHRTVERSDRTRVRTRENARVGVTSNVRISQSQRVRIRQAYERHRRSFHRVARVGFPIFIGAYWPRDYDIYDVPDYIVEYMPEYDGYKYIVVGDELLIIDPRTLEIVAIIPV